MNNSKKENLRELLASFMDTEAANRAAADIERGDELFGNWPAPKPSEALLAEVKQKMSIAAGQRRVVTLHHRIFAAAAVAAAIIILSIVTLKIFDNQPAAQPEAIYAATIPDQIWEGGSIRTDDPDIAALSNEIDNVADEISGVRLSDKNGGSTAAVGDVEMQIIEVSADFWKG
jgi:hypothetical protein